MNARCFRFFTGFENYPKKVSFGPWRKSRPFALFSNTVLDFCLMVSVDFPGEKHVHLVVQFFAFFFFFCSAWFAAKLDLWCKFLLAVTKRYVASVSSTTSRRPWPPVICHWSVYSAAPKSSESKTTPKRVKALTTPFMWALDHVSNGCPNPCPDIHYVPHRRTRRTRSNQASPNPNHPTPCHRVKS